MFQYFNTFQPMNCILTHKHNTNILRYYDINGTCLSSINVICRMPSLMPSTGFELTNSEKRVYSCVQSTLYLIQVSIQVQAC